MKLNNWELIGDSFYYENIVVKPKFDFYTLFVGGKPYHDFSSTLEDTLCKVEEYLKLDKEDREIFKFN
ncbi:MAG: hypothetical protein RSB94_08500 [Erysipelotrichaceae bacterium]